jgi:indole-3-acetate monooxygenase
MAVLLEGKRSVARNVQCLEPTTLDQVLSRITALAPLVAQHAREIEQGRRLPAELVSALKSARIYGMLVPRRYGGLELDAPSAFRALSALAKLDGSVGWNAMVGEVGSLMPFLGSSNLCERIFQDGKDHIIVGSSQPVGTAERVSGGWKVSGSWPFASGCQSAEWIGGACVMMEGGSPIDNPDGTGPMTRACLMPAEHWEIRDTWHAFGLKGTGSHHVALTDVLVPDENFFDFPFGASFAPDPIFGKLPEIVVLSHGAVAVGIAEGAIMDLVELARAGVKQMFMTTSLVETERFKEGLARLDADLMAARALLEEQTARVWQNPERAAAKDVVARVAEQLQAAIWITSACVRVAEGCFELAGSRAVYESSSLQRRVRDLRVAAQHVAVHPRHYVTAGAAVLARLS